MKHIEIFFLHVSNNFCVSTRYDFFLLRSNFLCCSCSRFNCTYILCVCCVGSCICVCRVVVLSFVQCTLQISIFSIRFTSNVLNVKIFSSNFITPLILLRCFLIFLVVLEPQYIQLLLPIRHINSMSYSIGSSSNKD